MYSLGIVTAAERDTLKVLVHLKTEIEKIRSKMGDPYFSFISGQATREQYESDEFELGLKLEQLTVSHHELVIEHIELYKRVSHF